MAVASTGSPKISAQSRKDLLLRAKPGLHLPELPSLVLQRQGLGEELRIAPLLLGGLFKQGVYLPGQIGHAKLF